MTKRNPQTKLLTKDYLYQRLVINKERAIDIANDIRVSKSYILYLSKKNGIDLRNKIDYTGKKIGRLKVLYKEEKRNCTGHYLWKCECECGNLCSVPSHNLASKNNKSCGCKRTIDRRLHSGWKGYGDISGAYFSELRLGAKRRNLIFDITIKELWELYLKQNKECALTGLCLSFSVNSKRKENQTASLDRIDSTKGYILDNLQWIHKEVNRLKLNNTEIDLIYWAGLITDYNRNKHE